MSVRSRIYLDGHFCLLSENVTITRIPIETYTLLNTHLIILLVDMSKIIAMHSLKRDGIIQAENQIADFQEAEKAYAAEVAEQLGIPLELSSGVKDLERVLEIIKIGGY